MLQLTTSPLRFLSRRRAPSPSDITKGLHELMAAIDDLKAAQTRLDAAVAAVLAKLAAVPPVGDVITAADAAPIIADLNHQAGQMEQAALPAQQAAPPTAPSAPAVPAVPTPTV